MLQIQNLTKIYRSGVSELVIFNNLSLEVAEGEQVAIVGESGAGKSTLLHLIAGMDTPASGRIYYKGTDLTALPEAALPAFRNKNIGYVWQQHHLLPEFTALENVAMPMLIRGEDGAVAARAAIEEVGLSARAHHRAGELSGGEQQRIAIARALASKPSLLLADEPTGNLDEKTGTMIFRLLTELRARRGLTTVLVTHNLQFARESSRMLKLEGGALHPM